jgi:cytochrome c-type biogenesis protein CcmH/NrfG
MASSSPGGRGWVALGSLLLLSACSGTAGKGGAPSLEITDPVAQIEAARASIAADSSDTEAWFLLARAWEVGDRTDSALVAYDELVARDPGNVKAIVHRGLALERAGRADEALAAYLEATQLAPDDPIPFVNLGSLQYFHYKRTFEAKEALTRALELDPGNPDAHFNLGVLFADANLFGEAWVEWQAVLRSAPEGGPAYNLAQENLERIRPLLDATRLEEDESGADDRDG